MNTSSPTFHDETYIDDLAAYALDALEPAEQIALQAHLETCAECQQTLAALQATADMLPYGLTPAEPPARLRRAIVERAQRDDSDQGTIVRPLAFWRRPTPAWATGLAAAAAIALAFWAGGLQTEVRQLRQALASSKQEVELVRQQLGEQGELLAVLQRNVTATMLEGGQGTAKLYRDSDGQAALIAALPPLPADRVYQAWVINGDTPQSAGLLRTDQAGQGTLLLDGQPLAQGATIAITNEPAGGSLRPTTPVLLAAQL